MRRFVILSATSTLLLAGCLDTDAKRGLAFSCTSTGDCLDGYYCDDQRCVEGIPPTGGDATVAADLDVSPDTSVEPDAADVDATETSADTDTSTDADTTDVDTNIAADADADADMTLTMLDCYSASPPSYACARPDNLFRITTQGENTHPVISSDGRDVVWISSGALVAADDDGGDLDVYYRGITVDTMVRLASNNGAGTGVTDLSVVPGEIVWIGTSGGALAGTVRYISTTGSGVVEEAGLQARYPSRAGACYAFVTTDALDATDTNGVRDFYLTGAGEVQPISTRPGTPGPLGMTTSAEPGQVALHAPALVYATPHVPNGVGFDDVVYVDLETGAESLLSADTAGLPGRDGVSRFPKVSHDGTAAVFWTNSSHISGDGSLTGPGALVVADTPRAATATPTVTVIWSYGLDDRQGDHAISGDGRYVVFSSSEQIDAATATGGNAQVWAYDREHDAFALVSASGGIPGDGDSFDVALDGSGCRVAFATEAENLVTASNQSGSDIIVAPMPLPPPDPDSGDWGVWTPHPGR